MANRIKLKRGLSSNINKASLQQGELAITTDTCELVTVNSSGSKVYPNKNVYVGTTTPTDSSVDVWVNPSGTMDRSALIDIIYPVGAVYLSVTNVNPSTLFGGTWSQITGYYLYAGTGGTTAGSVNSGASSGSTGGPSNNTSGSTTLTVNQIPSHLHQYSDSFHYYSQGDGAGGDIVGTTSTTSKQYTYETTSTGGGQGHTHTLSSHTHSLNSHTHSVNPVRMELYCWKRVS